MTSTAHPASPASPRTRSSGDDQRRAFQELRPVGGSHTGLPRQARDDGKDGRDCGRLRGERRAGDSSSSPCAALPGTAL
jgi:hypothetical protein